MVVNEELVIIGPSMGGQISRYALAYMEKEYQENPTEHQWNHNTRLWVSLDSPHQGANIPMGAQANIYFLGYIHGNQVAKDNYDLIIKSVAARQLLILQYPHGLPSIHATYYNNLANNGFANSNGYPQNLRKIAMVNGSLCSQKNGFASRKVLDIRAYTNILWFTHKAFQNQIWYINHTGQSNKIYYGMVDEVFSGYSLTSYFTNNYENGAIDMLAGGYFDTQGILKDQIVTELDNNNDIDEVSVFRYEPNHTFIPTHSALDTNGFSNWYQLIDENLVTSNKTPFDSYYGEVDNTDHTSFTQASKDWLFEELDGNVQSPPVFTGCDPISDIVITGPDTLCGTDQAIYSTNYANGGIFHDWSVDGFLIISEDNGHITLQRDPDYTPNYSTIISVTVSGSNVPGTKTISCSPPQFGITYNDNNTAVEIVLSDVENETPLCQQAITDVDWELTSGNSYILNATTEQAVFDDTYFTGTVTVTNAAGTTTKTYFWPDPNICYSIVKVGIDKYQVIDRCNYNEIISTMSLKEIYDIHGNKIADLPINYEELDIVNTGNTGDIRIIRVIINGEQVTKIIFKD